MTREPFPFTVAPVTLVPVEVSLLPWLVLTVDLPDDAVAEVQVVGLPAPSARLVLCPGQPRCPHHVVKGRVRLGGRDVLVDRAAEQEILL